MNSRSLLLGLSLLGLSSCVYDDGRDGYYDDYYYEDPGDYAPACSDVIERGSIDSDGAVTATPGEGVGVFVEYQGAGRWFVTTTCDTTISGFDCEFDIIANPLDGALLTSIAPADLERDDSLALLDGDRVSFLVYTGFDWDGFYVDTEPGAALALDVLLDGGCGNEHVFWVSNDEIREGIPSNPFEFEPVEP